jgi:hypothetical protein
MKNVFLVPTNKPSRLIKSKINNIIVLEPINVTINTKYWEYINIYITNNEEIKEGDWFIDDNQIFKCNYIKIGYWNFGESNNSDAICSEFRKHEIENCKKIIITTDKDLIKDGVQAIDGLNRPIANAVLFDDYTKDVYSVSFSAKKDKQILELEEDAEKEYGETKEDLVSDLDKIMYKCYMSGVEFGAKWQAERMYTEEQILKMLEYAVHESRMQDDKAEYHIVNETIFEFKKK